MKVYKTVLFLNDSTIVENERVITINGDKKVIPRDKDSIVFYSSDLLSALQFKESEVRKFIIERTLG